MKIIVFAISWIVVTLWGTHAVVAQSEIDMRLANFAKITTTNEIEGANSAPPKPYNEVKEELERFHRDFPSTPSAVFADLVYLDYLADLPKPTRLDEMQTIWQKVLALGNQYYSLLANISMARACALEMTPQGRNQAKTLIENALSGMNIDAVKGAYTQVKAIDRIAFPSISDEGRTKGVNAANTILSNMILLYEGKLGRNHKDLTAP